MDTPRPPGISGLLSQTFKLLKKHGLKLVMVTGKYQFLPMLAILLLYRMLVYNLFILGLTWVDPEPGTYDVDFWYAVGIGLAASFILVFILIPYAQAAVLKLLNSEQFSPVGAKASDSGLTRSIRTRLTNATFLYVACLGLIFAAGFIITQLVSWWIPSSFLLLLVGLFALIGYLSSRSIFLNQLITLEDKGVVDSFIESWRITKSRLSYISGTWGAVNVVLSLCSLLLYWLVYVVIDAPSFSGSPELVFTAYLSGTAILFVTLLVLDTAKLTFSYVLYDEIRRNP